MQVGKNAFQEVAEQAARETARAEKVQQHESSKTRRRMAEHIDEAKALQRRYADRQRLS